MGERKRPPKRLEMAMKAYEQVEHPQHYINDKGEECIDVMIREFGLSKVKAFCELNAFKYKFRAGKKPGALADTDRKKAEWYTNKLLELKANN